MKTASTATLIKTIFIAVIFLGLTLTAARAAAVFHDMAHNGKPGLLGLRLHSETPLWATLTPGESMHWWVEAGLEDTTAGTLALEMRSSGPLPESSGMTAEVQACTGHFDLSAKKPTCTEVLETVLTPTPLTHIKTRNDRYDLLDLQRDAPRHLLVTLAIPASVEASTIAGHTARIGLGIHAAGDTPSPEPTKDPESPPGDVDLPMTGADLIPLVLLATGLIGLGAITLVQRKQRARAGAT